MVITLLVFFWTKRNRIKECANEIEKLYRLMWQHCFYIERSQSTIVFLRYTIIEMRSIRGKEIPSEIFAVNSFSWQEVIEFWNALEIISFS